MTYVIALKVSYWQAFNNFYFYLNKFLEKLHVSLEHLNICILRIFFFLFTFSQKYPHVFRILARTEDIAFDLDTRTPVTVWLVLHQITVKTVCGTLKESNIPAEKGKGRT